MIYKTKRFNTTYQEEDHSQSSMAKKGAKAAGIIGGALIGRDLMAPIGNMVGKGVMAMGKNPLTALGAACVPCLTGIATGAYAGKKLGDKLLGKNQNNNQNQ